MENTYTPIVRKEKLPRQVVEQIQQLIFSRDLNPGDRLPTERELGERFKVSRTVIREAIRTLEARGLIRTQAGSGTFVCEMQGKEVASSLGRFINSQNKPFSFEALMEVRKVLEIEMVRLASQRATEEDIKQLENCLNIMCKTTDDIDEFSKWDLKFHLNLANACDNQLFSIVFAPLAESLSGLIWAGTTIPGAVRDACMFHRKILDCIKNKDSKGAEKNMRAHLAQSYRVVAEGIKNQHMEFRKK